MFLDEEATKLIRYILDFTCRSKIDSGPSSHVASLKEDYRDVAGRNSSGCHLDAYPVDQVVAVSFDHECGSAAFAGDHAREQGTKFRLCTGMQMDLWLLQKICPMARRVLNLVDDRQHLADTVSDISKIYRGPIDFGP